LGDKSIKDLINYYVKDYTKLLEKYENIIITDYVYNNDIHSTLLLCKKIGIVNFIHIYDLDFVEENILTCFSKIKNLFI
jgi:hypothetical protein